MYLLPSTPPPHHPAACSTWLLPLLRIMVVFVPSARNVGVGSALMLERQPAPGRKGAFADMLRLAPGEQGPPLRLRDIMCK